MINKFLLKLLMNGVVLIPLILFWTDAPFVSVALALFLLMVIAFAAGDELILPNSNNTIAVLSDVVLSFAYFWLASDFLDWGLSVGQIFIAAILVGVVEMLYHRVLHIWDELRAKFT
jgi:hypothetical protein